MYLIFLFFKKRTAYEMRISDWSSDVCSSDLEHKALLQPDEVPEPHGAVPAGRGGKAPVRRHGNAGHLARVAGEDVLQASAALEVPEPHRAVVAGRNRVAAAVDQRHGVHRALVVVAHLDGLLVLQVPQDEAVVEAGGDGAVADRESTRLNSRH